jgi:hypothetical protein
VNKIIFLGALCLMLNACYPNIHNDVVIKKNSDTVAVGEKFIAKLSVSYSPSVTPGFYIIKKRDTIMLPFDFKNGYAIYRAVGEIGGEKITKGYVEYINLKGIKMKEDFLIKFYIKPN